MDKKTTGIIATVVTAFLCGCPGLVGICFGALSAVASFIPGSSIDIFGSNNPRSALGYGIGGVCLGIVFVAIPIVVGVLMLRKKPEQAVTFNEPMPPAS